MEKSFVYNSSRIFYNVEGTGQPVILLHGFAEDRSIWNNQLMALKGKYCVIVPDLPGSGKSELIALEIASIDQYADCIKALTEAENAERVVLLGHSMGGYITLAFVKKYPGLLKAFGLVHSTAFADSDEKKASRKKGIEMMNEYGIASFLKNTIPNLFSKQFKQEHPEEVNKLIEQGQSFSKDALVQYYYAMMGRPGTTQVLEQAEVPVLFIVGTEDVAAPMQDLLEQVHLPRLSHIHILENAGHMSMLEKSELLNAYLLDFLSFTLPV